MFGCVDAACVRLCVGQQGGPWRAKESVENRGWGWGAQGEAAGAAGWRKGLGQGLKEDLGL